MPESLTGYYTYQPPGSDRVIHLALDAVDAILGEVLTGFGAIPRRGAEVGGLLLGRNDASITWIESYAMAPCEHRRGPSFLLSDKDREALAAAFRDHQAGELVPVGMFRSNTRDADAISDEDRTLFGAYFPPPGGVFLLIRPFASKTSVGTLLTWRDGVLPESNTDTFPFLRWELEGGPAARRRPLGERRPRPSSTPDEDRVPAAIPVQVVPAPAMETEQEPAALKPLFPEPPAEPPLTVPDLVATQLEPPARRQGWIWIPLSLIFLLLGALLGFLAALTFYPQQNAVDAAAFSLGLNATAANDNIHVRWNRDSPAIRAALHGRLEIRDGQYTKTVELESGALQTGSVMYPPLSDSVNLRLELSINARDVVSETIEWSKPVR